MLVAIPFVLTIALMVSSPTYLPMLLEEPIGHKLIAGSFTAMLLGILRIKKIIRIEV